MTENKKKTISVLGLLSLLLVVIGLTYAAFTYSKKGEVENTVTTAAITMNYVEGENKITMDNALPTTDDAGKILTAEGQIFDFTVSFNMTGKTSISYEVTGEKDNASTLDDEMVRIYLERSTDGTNYSSIYEPTGYIPLIKDDPVGAKAGEMLLDSGIVNESLTYYYRLRMWVSKDYEITGESKFFTLRINVYGNDSDVYVAHTVKIEQEDSIMLQESTLQLSAILTPDELKDKTIKWTSSNPDVAEVSSTGLVTAKEIGEAEITATTKEGKKDKIKITVVTNKYTMVIEKPDGTKEELVVKNGDTFGSIPVPERPGYDFDGWYTEKECGETKIEPDTPIDGTITNIYPCYRPKEYEITIDSQDGTEPTTIKVTYDSVYENLPTPTKEGYTFDGWFKDQEFTEQVKNGDKVDILENTNLYAKWSPNKYTVTLNPSGGTVDTPSIEVTYNYVYSTLPTPTRTGFTFAGWYTENSGGTIVNSTDTVKILSDTTLYAHWTGNNYRINFNANGGSVSPTQQDITYGSTYGSLPTPTKNGYNFDGWWTALSGGEQITASSTVNVEGITVYAHWKAKTFSVNFNSNGGNAVSTVLTVTYDSTYGSLPSASRTGYNFAGWWTTASGGSQVTNTTKVSLSSNQTLYAHWNIQSYGVTINVTNASRSVASLNINYGSSGNVTITPTSGYYLSSASCTNGYTTNAGTGTSKTGAQNVTISNNSKTTGSTCTFNATKLVNQNITNPPACVTSGTCNAGQSVTLKVNSSTSKNFYVLKDNGSTLTLITDSLVMTSTQWNSSRINSEGPVTATQALENATSSWTNMPINTYNGATGQATRARLITLSESQAVGCTYSRFSCPSWLVDPLYFHWTSTAYDGDNYRAYHLTTSNDQNFGQGSTRDNYGIRAVVTVSK